MTARTDLTQGIVRLHVDGFRSLRSVELDPGRLTVLIGPNGSGKSNLLSLLRMIPLMRTRSLRRFIGESGGASSLLHYGPKRTPELSIRVEFQHDASIRAYSARLGHAAGDTLVFLDESVEYSPEAGAPFQIYSLGEGHQESELPFYVGEENLWASDTIGAVYRSLSRMSFFHFHDTSSSSPLRQNGRQPGDQYLRSDGSNLAAFLLRLASSRAPDDIAAWKRIGMLVRQIAPYVKRLEPDFVDSANPATSSVRLRWVDQLDYRFDVSDLSDGTLRALALITALSQPVDRLPTFISIDEPELGLHPAAITLLVGLIRSVAPRCQVLLATQSPALLDHFEPEEVVVAERKDGETLFRRLDPEALASWLEDYSLSQLYDKNVLGGRP